MNSTVETQNSLPAPQGEARFKYNPAHPCGTCGDCGEEMVWNVPRLGPTGGFVHKATGRYECNPPKGT
jgi:hypothetical protein